MRRIRAPLSSHIAYITTVNAIATTAPPKFRCVLAIAPEWLEGAPAGGGVGFAASPVNPGIVTDGRGDYKRNQRRQLPCTLSLPCVISRMEILEGK